MHASVAGFSLSPQQEHLCDLFGSAGSMDAGVAVALLAEAPALDSRALVAALAAVVARHEILRTAFTPVAGLKHPLQTPDDTENSGLHVIDLQGRPEHVQASALDRLFAERAELCFPWDSPATLDASVVRLSAGRAAVLLRASGLQLDYASIPALIGEIGRAYDRCVSGACDADEPIQYIDYTSGIRELLASDAARIGRAHWPHARLADGLRVRLPREHPGAGGGERATLTLPLDPALIARAERVVPEVGARLPTFFLTCWHLLLWRLTGAADVLVGTYYDGRTYEGTESALGPYARCLPVCLAVDPRWTFRDALVHVASLAASAAEYQDYFDWTRPGATPPSAEAPPSCPYQFEWREPLATYASPALRLSAMRHHMRLDRAHVKLTIARDASAMRAEFEYAPALLEARDVADLMERWRTLAAHVAADPGLRIADVPIVGPVETTRLLVERNGAARRSLPAGRTVMDLIDVHAREHPSTVALHVEGERITYGELDRRASQLARHLVEHGATTESRIGLLLDRSSAVIAMLAVMKAGACYVPLDPRQPAERLATLLREAQASLLVTSASFQATVDRLPRGIGRIRLDADRDVIAACASEPFQSLAVPDALAYVIFTSGSTGLPKGVGVEHRHLASYVCAVQEQMLVTRGAQLAHVSTFAADLGNTVLYAALCWAGTLHVIADDRVMDGERFAEYVAANPIDYLKITPSHAESLFATAGTARILPRRMLILGGETAARATLDRLRSADPPCGILNHYGPTETTVGVLTFKVPQACMEECPAELPIGRPLRGVAAYILDRSGQLAPDGTAGDLYIGGASVARGYLNGAALTAERFAPDPFGDHAGARLYATGDRARFLPDGTIQFLGRRDDQVKLRGYRVELGEIQSVLAAHPALRACVVVARDDEALGQKLVAYYVPQRTRASAIDGRARRRMPDGLAIVPSTDEETARLHRAIVERRRHLPRGVSVPPGGCVFDVGAHVGLFAMFAARLAADVRVCAFEPAESLVEALRINASLYCPSARIFPCALGRTEGFDTLLYRPDAPGQSTTARGSTTGSGDVQRRPCRTRRVSDVIHEERIGRIALLKIDVGGSELDVLAGIDEPDWPRIAQVVVRVYAADGDTVQQRAETVAGTLRQRGFDAAAAQDEDGTVGVSAVRPDARVPAAEAAVSPDDLRDREILTVDELRAFAADRLPDYMVPAVWIELDALPLTPNGKIDRQALPAPDKAPARCGRTQVAPRTLTEELLANIWADVLRVERVGVGDNFFELGGQSLLAMQVLWRVREAFRVDVPLRALFDAPAIEALAAVVDRLRRTGEPVALPPIAAVPRLGDMPLSFAQERLWFVDQLAPDSVAYNMPMELRLRGALDAAAFAAAVGELIQRHEILRTSFPSVNGGPVQRIAPELSVTMPLVDLSRLSASAGEGEARRLSRRETRRPFDLSKTPLIRAWLLRLGPDDHVVMSTMHHIVSDGWSMSVLVREFTALYQALSDGTPMTLPELPIQYADYAAWQRAQLTDAALEGDLEYWRRHLAGPLPVLALGNGRRAGAGRWSAGRASTRLGADTLRLVRQLGRKQGTTVFMTLLAALHALLHRYTGEADIVVGTPVAGRNRTELEGLIGFFVNTLALRGHVTGDATFAELLEQVRETTLDAWAHQDAPFERVVDAVAPDRAASRQPLFQVSFAVRNARAEALALEGLHLEFWAADSAEPKLELAFQAEETGRDLEISLEYAEHVFDRNAIDCLLDHFKRLLACAAAEPARRIRDLDLLAEHESRNVLHGWNHTSVPVAGDLVPALVARRAAERPDAPALREANGRVRTYAEVNAQANRWARRLRELGVEPDTRVGVCLERSADLITLLLAVLKAGGAYVPLDPAYPRERLAAMCDDAGAAFVLCDTATGAAVPAHVRVVHVDAEAEAVARRDGGDLPGVCAPDHLAYVIYTSGSTGRPKGVMIPHRGLSNLVAWHVRAYDIQPSDCGSFLANLSFDASVWELWPYLASGASVALIPGVSGMTPRELAAALGDGQVTVTFLPTPLFDVVAAEGQASILDVRSVLVGGDVLHHGAEAGSRYQLVNHYGPTETSVVATAGVVPPLEHEAIAIGAPISNTQTYVATIDMDVVPVGVPGDLYIGGAGLARGYLHQPALTADRFLPDPFGSTPGARVYRTGDLVRWRSDGQLEFLGRRDGQVKVRGHRVELGEIETLLAQHPDVRAAVVLVHEGPAGASRLVASVVGRDQPGPSIDALRAWLEARLPAPMVPAEIVHLDALPLTPNGKIDRAALQRAHAAPAAVETLAPRDITEMQVARIWEELLGVEARHVEARFFKSGGTSLMLVVLRHKLEQLFNVRLPVDGLYQHDSIAAIAAAVRNSANAPVFSCLVPLRPHGAKPPTFFVHPGGGTVMCLHELAKRIGAGHPLFAFRASGLESGEAPHRSIEAMAAHYVDLLLAAHPNGPYRLAGWSSGGVIAFAMASTLAARGLEVERLVLLDTSCPLAYEQIPRALVDSTDLLINTVGLPKTGGLSADEFRRLPLDDQLALVLQDQRAARRVLGHVDLAEARRHFDVLRCGAEAIPKYVPAVYGGPVSLFRATGAPPWTAWRALGWEQCAARGVEIFEVPGTHGTMLNANVVEPLAAQLTALLDGGLTPVDHAPYSPAVENAVADAPIA